MTALILAQPVVSAGGIINGASFRLAAAPGGGITPGSIISIFGTGMATGTASASSIPLPTSLGGTSVTIGGKTAPLYFVSAGQINAQVPWGVTAGSQPVVVTLNGAASAAVNVTVQTASPGIFTQASNGKGPGAIQNFVSQGNTPLNNAVTAIQPGGLIIIYATGLGPVVDPQPADGAAGSGQATRNPVSVKVGTSTLTPQFAGLSPGFVGLYQVNVQLPASLTQGCNISVSGSVLGQTSNTVTLSAAQSGNCTTLPTEYSPAPNGSAGAITLSRLSFSLLGQSFSIGSVGATFQRFGPFAVGSTLYPPSGGGCIVDISAATSSSASVPTFLAGATGLDAGALTWTGPGGSPQVMPQTATGNYSLGASGANFQGITIGTGTHTVAGAGGKDVGPFTATNTVQGQFNGKTDIPATNNASQAAGFTASWSACPDPNGTVVIGGASIAGKLQGTFFCTAACSALSYKVGSDVLTQLPLSDPQGFTVLMFFVGTPTRFQATGLTQGGSFVFVDGTGLTGFTLGQ